MCIFIYVNMNQSSLLTADPLVELSTQTSYHPSPIQQHLFILMCLKFVKIATVLYSRKCHTHSCISKKHHFFPYN